MLVIYLRSKAQVIEEGERNSKYFASLEKKKAESKIISRLNIKDKIITDQKDIINGRNLIIKTYFQKRTLSIPHNFFDDNIGKLDDAEQHICDSILTEHELPIALKEKKNKKSPGSDGLTTEFCKLFWNDIKQFYINSINYSYQNGKLTELQTQSMISLIPKPGKDNSFLENWRPICLLNVDYKIATKAIANRVKKVLPKLFHNSQIGFMKGRYIGENIRQIFEVLEHAEEQEIPGLIFFSDFEKAFDSVDHDFLNRCLN